MTAMIDTKAEALLAKYDYAVPRYTSFPTAVQFKPDVSQDFHRQCLSDIKPDTPISLYVHIPFCHSLCHYCGCHTKIVNRYEPVKHYISSLIEEIGLTGNAINKKLPVSRLHFGGGSPNYAYSEDLRRIITAISDVFDTSSMQIDMECDPRLLDEQKIAAYANLGISRVSLGIQDFDDNVQQAINRIQPFSFVQEQVALLRAAGIEHINFDLITGLPEQTLKTVERTLERVLALLPSRVAVFPYAHVPWMKKHQKLLEQYRFPDVRQRFEMGALVNATLTGYGYQSIGIDHYALKEDSLYQAQKAGTMRRNFQGYTDDPSRVILGFGLSSISQFDDAYTQNTVNAPDYRAMTGGGAFSVVRGLTLSREDKRRRALIEQLMCRFQIDFTDFQDIDMPYADLAVLAQDGIIRMEQNVLRVTDKGKPFTRIVAACFDPYFEKKEGRHAKAV